MLTAYNLKLIQPASFQEIYVIKITFENVITIGTYDFEKR